MHIEFEKINKGFVKLELIFGVGVKWFRITTQNYLVIGYKLFFLWFILLLIKMGWNRLIGHPKDQLNYNHNSRRNSLQLKENDANEFTSRLNRVKHPYLVISTSERKTILVVLESLFKVKCHEYFSISMFFRSKPAVKRNTKIVLIGLVEKLIDGSLTEVLHHTNSTRDVRSLAQSISIWLRA